MSFYLATKGNVQPFHFQYLSSKSLQRLDATRVKGTTPQTASPNIIEHKKSTYVIQIMSKKIISASPASTLKNGLVACQQHQIHHLPIIVDQIIVGFLSDRDILQHLNDKHYLHQIMSDTMLLCSENTSITDLANVMIKENISALPVINDHLQLVGIVTHRDILKWVVNEGYLSL